MTSGTAASEPVQLVDDHGRPAGSAPREVMRRETLRHAATAVLVRDPSGRIYVHRRSRDKDWWPGAHDAAAGGVMVAGEQPLAAAERELAEELGVQGSPLRPLGAAAYEDDTVRCFTHLFETTYDGPVRHVDGEVAWGGWTPLPELGRRLRDPRWRCVPDTRAALDRLCEGGVGDYARLGGVRPGEVPPPGVGVVLAAAEALGLHAEVVRHGPVRSLEEAARARGVEPARLAKTLVVRLADDDFRLVLVPGDREVAWPALRALLGVNRVSLPGADVALEATGFERGTITPLGSVTAWPVVVDASVLEAAAAADGRISLGAGEHGAGLMVDAAALVAALDATVATVSA